MTATNLLLSLVFSFSANSANESSAVEQMKSIPSERANCKAGEAEYGKWKLEKKPLPKERVDRAVEMLNEIKSPAAKDLDVIRAALKVDPAGALPHYMDHTNCGMLRRHLTSKLIEFAKSNKASETEKAVIKSTLTNVIQSSKYEMFIEAMIDAAILGEIYSSKIFSAGSGPDEIESLAALKARLTTEAKTTFPEEMRADFPGLGEEKPSDVINYSEKLRNNKKFEKYKGRWNQEAEMSGRALAELRQLAAKLK